MESEPVKPRKYEYVYMTIITFIYWHMAALYGLYLAFTSAKWATLVFAFILYQASGLGVTAGAHRLWSHKAYKAKLPLEIMLMIFNSLCYQYSAAEWIRNHRLHHKFSDTDADPHNASRGLFFSHIGWLMVRKHPEIREKGKVIDMSDIDANPVLQFQKRYALLVFGMIGYVLPTVIPMYFWGESLNNAWHITMFRVIAILHVTLLVNSVAHMFGYKPYDKTIRPVQALSVSFFSFGEGFHNYHHCFPWDYRTAELGDNWLNPTTRFIDFFAWIGWAYDLKTAKEDIVKSRASRLGDGSRNWKDKDEMSTNILNSEFFSKEQ